MARAAILTIAYFISHIALKSLQWTHLTQQESCALPIGDLDQSETGKDPCAVTSQTQLNGRLDWAALVLCNALLMSVH